MSIRRSFTDLFTHLQTLNFTPSSVIDVGAADGTDVLYQFYPDVPHYAFEPNKEFLPRLKMKTKNLNCQIFECGLMDKSGSANFYRHPDPYGSTFMCKVESPQTEQFEITTLDLALGDAPLGSNVLLKTDCQGADLFVVRGGRQILKKCEIVIMEASLFPFWGPHEPIFDEIVHEMSVNGFKVYDLLDGLNRPHDGALGQVDIVFARTTGCLRTSNAW
jgi:FkbM family methyltransferase